MSEMNDLYTETKEALLEVIKEAVPGKKGNASGIAQLSYAFALVVGAAPGYLPGSPPASSS
jgi:hypothetical protein